MADTTLARALVAASFLISLTACPPDGGTDAGETGDCFNLECKVRIRNEDCEDSSNSCITHVGCQADADCAAQPYPGYCTDGVCTYPVGATMEVACFYGSGVIPRSQRCGTHSTVTCASTGQVCRMRPCSPSASGCTNAFAAPVECRDSQFGMVCHGPGADGGFVPVCSDENYVISLYDCDESTDAGSTDAGSTDAGSTDAGSVILPDGGVITVANIFNFAFDRTVIATGDMATLSWVVAQEPAADCTVNPGNVSFNSSAAPTGSMQVGTSGTSTLTCTTAAGTVARQATLQVVTNGPPNATIDTPAMSMTWEIGDAITFTGTCTDDNAGGSTLSHVWNFGTLTGPAMSFDYTEDPAPVTATTAGTFTVTYDCADTLGVTDPTPASISITVVDPIFATVKGVRSLIGQTCGLTASGKLFCWGSSFFGVLGQGPGSVDTSRPKRVGNALWTSFDVGTQLSCAINAAHELWCWGWREAGSTGTIGNGMTTMQDSPVQLPGSDWASVSLGNNHVCAVKTSGALHCWGENVEGQLGLGASTTAQLAFTPVNGDLDWVSVAAGDRVTCALKTGNRLFCWGLNDYGQLGTGSTTPSRVPVEVGAAIDWAQVQTTSATTCGVDVLGKAYCWGADFFGQLGDGTPNNNVAGATKVPTQVGVATDWAEVRPGWSHTCGRKTTGTAWCWGADTNGQLGDGTASTTQTVVPTQVGGDADWSQLSANDNYTCGVRAGGHAWCWGLNLAGVLGNGTTMNASTPVEVRATP